MTTVMNQCPRESKGWPMGDGAHLGHMVAGGDNFSRLENLFARYTSVNLTSLSDFR